MPPTDDPEEPTIDSVGVRHDLLRVERDLERREEGVVVTLRITGRAETPVTFQLIDPLPGGLTVEEVGFHPDFEPMHGRLDDRAAILSGVVDRDRGLVVKYGLVPAGPVAPGELEALQASARPSIDTADAVAPGDDVESTLERATMTRSASADTADDLSPLFSTLTGTGRGEDGPREAPVEGGGEQSAADGADPDGDRDTAPPDAAAGATHDGDAADATAEDAPAAIGGDPFGSSAADADLAADLSRNQPEGEPWWQTVFDTDDVTAADAEYRAFSAIFRGIGEDADEPAADAGPAPEASEDADEPTPDAPPVTTSSEDANGPPDDVVGAVTRLLAADDDRTDLRRRLAAQLRAVLDDAEGASADARGRLDRLEAELEGAGTQLDALEAVIDEHGPAEAFLADVRSAIAGLDASIADVGADLDEASATRRTLTEELAAVSDAVGRLDSRTERLEDAVESLQARHRSRFAALEGETADQERLAAEVERLEAELGSVREAVRDGEARRRAIASALASDDVGD